MRLRLALCTAAGGMVGGTVALGLPEYSRKRSRLDIQVRPPSQYIAGVNVFPIATACLGLLPPFLREKLLLSQTAPRPSLVPKPASSPYTVQEVKQDKVWRVGYERENHFLATWETRQQMKMLGLDFSLEETCWRVMQGAEKYGRLASEAAHRDLAMARNINQMEAGEAPLVTENMVVVKLESGGLLLYCPVRVQQGSEFSTWLKAQGEVAWIVLGSSEHTLQLPEVLASFPSAKVIGATTAEKKLQWVAALPKGRLDFDCTKPAELAQANSLLDKEGVSLHYVHGDCVTHSLFALAHGVLCEADLLYTHQDGEGFLHIDKDRFRELRPEDALWRLFKFGLLSKPTSPNGFLPPYRYWMMDPGLMWPVMLTPPNADGSSSLQMAESLRNILALPFDTAVGVHFDPMGAAEFQGSLDCNWNWLDGSSLLTQPTAPTSSSS